MEINITVDTQSFKNAALSLVKSRLFQGMAMILLIGASTYAYAINNNPTHVFLPGQPISSADVNQNFSELYSTLNNVELEVTNLTSEVDMKSALSRCGWKYGFRSTAIAGLNCPADTYAISGSCSVLGSSQVLTSRPSRSASGSNQPLTAATGWFCSQSQAGALDIQVLCCPL